MNFLFGDEYSKIEGVFSFRGNNFRTGPSYGVAKVEKEILIEDWSFNTYSSTWGGGAGWTGQVAMIKWPANIKNNMNVSDDFKVKNDGIEVIQASLDGNIYFLDADTGEQTREKIN
ncbi:MAG: hypothetical protein ACRCWM_11540 [Sarcina sp.]